MVIDNFDIIRKHLEFKTSNDRYLIHILRRPKDCEQLKNTLGSNETQRLIKTYYIDNIEYFDSKIQAIKELCITCKARAYFIPQVKDNFECLLNLGKKIFDTIQNKNYSVKPEHLLRQSYCEFHKSRKKQWVIDLDKDCMTEYIHKINFGGSSLTKKTWILDDVVKLVTEKLKEIGKNENNMYIVPTKNGYHIITDPFNLKEAQEECSLMFEGEKSFVVNVDNFKHTQETRNITGWLHKDGMTLLYYNI